MAKTLAMVRSITEFNSNDFQIRLVRGTFSITALCLVLYISFVFSTIVNVVERRGFEEKSRAISSRLSLKESEYLNLAKSANINQFSLAGFEEADPQAFVTRGADSVAVSITR